MQNEAFGSKLSSFPSEKHDGQKNLPEISFESMDITVNSDWLSQLKGEAMNNKKILMRGFAGLLIATALLMANSVQAQPQTNTSQDNVASAPFRRGMMAQSDQHFIVMMIPHHEGAIAMADLALKRAQPP